MPSSHPHQRKLRNYLLDPVFQLRYANFAAAGVLGLSLVLGTALWRTSEKTLEESRAGVALGQKVLVESRKVSEVVRMNIAQDAAYAGDPALRDAFEADARRQEAQLASQHKQLRRQAARLETQRLQFGALLLGGLCILVVSIWAGAIVLTHKVAGPIFKMRRQLRDLEAGSYRVPAGLRKGDQLEGFFGAFNDMVVALRHRQSQEIAQLDLALDELSDGVDPARLQRLRELRADMQASLDT